MHNPCLSLYVKRQVILYILCPFRSGTNGLNEELGRHSTRNNSKACVFCECESVKHVLWECSEYSSIHKEFIRNLDGILQNNFLLHH